MLVNNEQSTIEKGQRLRNLLIVGFLFLHVHVGMYMYMYEL